MKTSENRSIGALWLVEHDWNARCALQRGRSEAGTHEVPFPRPGATPRGLGSILSAKENSSDSDIEGQVGRDGW